jgi:hypothetical protein
MSDPSDRAVQCTKYLDRLEIHPWNRSLFAFSLPLCYPVCDGMVPHSRPVVCKIRSFTSTLKWNSPEGEIRQEKEKET